MVETASTERENGIFVDLGWLDGGCEQVKAAGEK
jgi:hypothetical protein